MMISKRIKLAQSELSQVSDAADLDASWLMLHVLEQEESSWLHAHGDGLLSSEEEKKYAELVERRKTGEPLAYILGYWEFYGRRFKVNKDVLIPRPSTEALIDAVLPKLHEGMAVADIGTGSGCIAVTLILESGIKNQELRILAMDVSPAALKIAKKNAELHEVADKIEFIQGDMIEALKSKKVDLIVSNPPYIPTKEILPFEPVLALDGGVDGQKFINQIKVSDVPAMVETTGGAIRTFNLK